MHRNDGAFKGSGEWSARSSGTLRGEREDEIVLTPNVYRPPKVGIVLDNGPELSGRVLDKWAHERGIKLVFIRRSKVGGATTTKLARTAVSPVEPQENLQRNTLSYRIKQPPTAGPGDSALGKTSVHVTMTPSQRACHPHPRAEQ